MIRRPHPTVDSRQVICPQPSPLPTFTHHPPTHPTLQLLLRSSHLSTPPPPNSIMKEETWAGYYACYLLSRMKVSMIMGSFEPEKSGTKPHTIKVMGSIPVSTSIMGLIIYHDFPFPTPGRDHACNLSCIKPASRTVLQKSRSVEHIVRLTYES